MKKLTILLTLQILILTSIAIFSQALPNEINYQGVLKDASGVTVANGDYTLTFKLYDSESGGTDIWKETKLITMVDGIISTKLGSINPIILPFDKSYWLGITIGADSELNPRTKLSTVPYSHMSMNVMNGSITAEKISGGEIVKSINSLKDNINLVAGSNITITPGGNNLTISASGVGSGTIGGSGTTNYIPVFTGTTEIGNSKLIQDGLGLLLVNDLSSNINPTLRLNRTGTNSATSIAFNNTESYGITIGLNSYHMFSISSLNKNIGVEDVVVVDGVQKRVGIGTWLPMSTLDVDGTILLSGTNTNEINRAQTTDANLVPIAYGQVAANSSLRTNATTSNITIASHPNSGEYHISITGENFYFGNYTCIVTLADSEMGEISWNSVSGNLIVYTANSAGVLTDKPFSFVVYKK
jgi:hypothetical protein